VDLYFAAQTGRLATVAVAAVAVAAEHLPSNYWMTAMNNQSMEQRWHSYMTAFGTVSEHERERLLENSVSEDVVFTNPGATGNSRNGLSAHIGRFQKVNPGAYFQTDKLFLQNDKLLAIWSMYKQDGTKLATGYNFVTPDSNGLFNYMVGFF
jgi:hypothetical protein